MKDEKTGKFVLAGRISERLAALEAPEKFVTQARAIESGETCLKGYLRKPALNGLARFFELAVSQGIPLEFQESTITAYLGDLDERSTGPDYWLRYTTAMQEVAREMCYPYEIIDGFEGRLGPAA
ncbi:hypothetical protein [Leisingera aquimarina]|uniref:hypothetical protein n=1 Tax=Leisingera aquimarina TaxID=476529 RepID=UPI0003F68DC7|nr:hypothetical protein [Leisingera aquimarina]